MFRWNIKESKSLPLLVVEGTGPSLQGRGWYRRKPNLTGMKSSLSLQQVLSKHERVFKEQLGTLIGVQAAIHVAAEATPGFYRPRSVPYAMKPNVDVEIDTLCGGYHYSCQVLSGQHQLFPYTNQMVQSDRGG